MKTKIKLDKNRAIEVDSSLNWLWIYRQQFGRDILPDLLPAIETAWKIVGGTLEKTREKGLGVGALIAALFDEEVVSDIFVSIYGFELTTILQIIWAMAKNADESIPNCETWINGFDNFPVDEVIPQTVKVITESSISSKNLKRLRAVTKAKENR